MRTFKIYSLSNFQIHHTAVLATVTVLYIIPSVLIYLVTAVVYLLNPFIQFSHSPPPRSGHHKSGLFFL